jgi:ABC-type multidrug transport system fused ATPase/permease subunit
VFKKQGRKKGALVLDEVTESVDLETENVMMSMIKREFAGWTVLAVVHRLETINYDKVVVFDQGGIVELGEPRVFEMGRNSWFGRQILTLFKVNSFDLD